MNSSLLLLDKAPGITSFEALFPVKRAIASSKAGHTGTLDKFASGLLVVPIARALKLSPYLTGRDKHYEAVVRFGTETDTLDPEGNIVSRAVPPSFSALEAALPLFKGNIMQRPPEYSALHFGGRRAYELARKGLPVALPERPVTIYGLELDSFDGEEARLRVHCSSGTYIRSLARDLAVASGSRAHLSALRRTRVGAFRVEDALRTQSREEILRALRPVDRGLFSTLGIPVICFDVKSAQALRGGRPIEPLLRDASGAENAGNGDYAMFAEEEWLGMIKREKGVWSYIFVICGN